MFVKENPDRKKKKLLLVEGFSAKVPGKGEGSPCLVGTTSKIKGGRTFLVRGVIQGLYFLEIILLDTVLY